MSRDNKTTTYVNFGGLFGLFGLVLVTLKLGGVAPVAAWSWWLVTMPFWIGAAIVAFWLVILVITVLFAVAVALLFDR